MSIFENVQYINHRKHRYGKMGAVPVPGTSWVRIPPGYRCMRTPAVPIFGQKKKIPVRFWYGSGMGQAKTVPFKVNLKLKYLLQNLLSHSISLLCNAARSLSLHRRFSLSHFLLYQRRATERKGYGLLIFCSISSLRISSLLLIRSLGSEGYGLL